MSSVEPRTRDWAPTWSRSVRLFRDFRVEQSDPDRFYRALAHDSLGQLGRYTALDRRTLLDVGGGPGYFADAFTAAGVRYVGVEPDPDEFSRGAQTATRSLVASGLALPFADASFDITYSSNVLEHVSRPFDLVDEMLRVTKPGGIAFVSFTTWYGPWGGHETSPWHYLGGERARARHLARHGREPKNRYGESLFKVTVNDAVTWARDQQRAEVVDIFPRYHPSWAAWTVRVPVLSELTTWNLVVVLRAR